VVATTSAPFDAARRWYVLGLLMLVYALNIADRFVMSTLIEPIKADLGLSDFSIAFLTGTALACFYVTAGLPLAYLADRANRRSLVAAALAAWSVMTAACGIVQNYWQMLVARIGVGVGEAGGTPPSVSLLSDYFPWRSRALAMSIYSLGLSLGSALGTSAGFVSDAWGWRAAFLVRSPREAGSMRRHPLQRRAFATRGPSHAVSPRCFTPGWAPPFTRCGPGG
jgi:MFS family permease